MLINKAQIWLEKNNDLNNFCNVNIYKDDVMRVPWG